MAAWDRRKDETTVEYARFVAYLRLGPLRSYRKAYEEYTRRFSNADPAGKKGQSAPGQWTRDSNRLKWRERAKAYDLHSLKRYGSRAAILFVRNMDRMAAKVHKALPTAELGGEEWPDIISTMALLGKQLTPDALRGEDEDAAGDGDTGAADIRGRPPAVDA